MRGFLVVAFAIACALPLFAVGSPRDGGVPPTSARCSVWLTEENGELPFDLDGDGRRDHWVTLGCGATGNCYGLLVVSNGADCPRLVGEVSGIRPVALAAASHGLRDVAIFHRYGCAGNSGVLTWYRYNGSNYVEANSVTCLCGDEPDAGPRDARCDSWRQW